jgi:hypothetical protein
MKSKDYWMQEQHVRTILDTPSITSLTIYSETIFFKGFGHEMNISFFKPAASNGA